MPPHDFACLGYVMLFGRNFSSLALPTSVHLSSNSPCVPTSAVLPLTCKTQSPFEYLAPEPVLTLTSVIFGELSWDILAMETSFCSKYSTMRGMPSLQLYSTVLAKPNVMMKKELIIIRDMISNFWIKFAAFFIVIIVISSPY